MSAKANTTDAKGAKAGKKPRGPSKQGSHRQTTDEASDQPEQGGTKKGGTGYQVTGKARIWKTIKGCSKRDSPTAKEKKDTRGR